jgi:hypothetical protein
MSDRFDARARQNCEAILAAWPHSLCGYKKPLGAQGIAAEILFCGAAAKKIGAESPARCAHII